MPDPLAPESRPFIVRPGSPAERLMYCRDLIIRADGPTGSGKTRPVLEKIHFCCGHWPGTRALLLRKAKAHAATTIMQTWETQVVPTGDPAGILQARNYKSPAYQYGNGSFCAVDGMYDGSGYNMAVMGTEWDIIAFDEGTQATEDDAMRLIGRLNRIAPTPERIPFNQIMFPCNPEAPTHWLHKWGEAGKLTCIPSRLEDNPVFHNGTDWTPQGLKYLATVDKYTGVMRERNRFGRWVGAEGMIFDEWNEKVHIVDRLPPGSEDWWRVRSIDFGYREPFVCLWGVVDPNGRIYIEREYVRCNKTVSKHAPELKRLTPDEGLVQFTVADHDAEDRATLAENDIDTVPAIKPRKDTDWAAHFDWVKRRLQPAADGFPRLFVVRDSVQKGGGREPLLGSKPCGIIEEITGYQWEEPKPDKASRERPLQVNDHAMDSLRYLCLAVDRWFDGEAERDKPDFEEGSIGEALGLNDEDED